MTKKPVIIFLTLLTAAFVAFLKPSDVAAYIQATYPINYTTVSVPRPTFTWNTNTGSYQVICVGTYADGHPPGSCNFVSCTADFGSGTRSYTMPYNLASNTSYSWLVYTGPPLWESTGCQHFQTPNFCTNSAPAQISLSSPGNGASGISFSPSLTWNAETSWGSNCSGNTNTYSLYFGTSSTPPLKASSLTSASYTVSGLSSNTVYYWYVVASNGNQSSTPSPTWSFTTNAPPTINNVTINAGTVRADNSTQYTITTQASDPNGAGDIYGEYALINYQGENAGQYRGYLTWGINNYWPGYQDWHTCSGSGGYAVVQPGYGNTYIHLDGCSVSDSGNNRTVTFTVRIDPSFTGPSDNDISGYVFDSVNQTNGWINSQTNFSVCPATVAITGTISSIPSGNTSAAYANTYLSNTVSAPSGSYSVSVPTVIAGTSYSVFASQISGYTALPTATPVSVSCSSVAGPNFSYQPNACVAAPDTSLIAVYHLDESSGQIAADSSGNNNNGLATGTTIVAGKYGNARSFGGSDQVSIPKSASLSFTNALTVAAWVYPRDCSHGSSGHNTIVAQENGLLLAFNNSCQVANWVSVNGSWRGPDGNGATIPLNQWSYLAMTWDGTTLRSYLNGQFISGSGTSASGSWTNSSNNYYLGARTDCCTQTLNGIIDEVRIWNRALTPVEVAGEYQKLCATGVKTNCGAWSNCQSPRGTDITCGIGYKYRTCYDSGDTSPIDDTPQYCILQPPHIISDSIMNAPQAVTVTATNTSTPTGGSCPASVTSSPASQTNYSLSLPALCGYSLTAYPVSTYTISPNNYQITVSCTDMTGPTFWYNDDAGPVTQSTSGQTSPLYYGAGLVSESGNTPGYRLESYSNAAPLNKVTYQQLLDTAVKNVGMGPGQNPCQTGRLDLANASIFCYNESTYPFETVLRSAVSSGPNSPSVTILYPDPGTTFNSLKTITNAALSIPANKTLVVFVAASLEVQQNITVDSSAGIVFILNAANQSDPNLAGNLFTDASVSELDGIYVFPGFFTDTQGSGDINLKLTGYGSLLSVGNQAFNLNRAVDSALNPGEEWHFQSKYLDMYKNILSSPRFTWKELPPN